VTRNDPAVRAVSVSMRYVAHLALTDRDIHITFPDAPDCQASAPRDEDVRAIARQALERWLEARLVGGDAPPPPRHGTVEESDPARATPSGARTLCVRVSPGLAIAVRIRQRRLELGLSVAEMGRLLGVTRQRAYALERPRANYRLSTLERVADALQLDLDVSLTPRSAARDEPPIGDESPPRKR
jgi:DNA-binding XRE family transcriptional regulator